MGQDIRSYAAKQGLITFACTVLICGGLCFLLVKSDMLLSAIYLDLSITVASTSFFCVLIQVFVIKALLSRGSIPSGVNLKQQAAYLLVPQNVCAFLIYIVITGLWIFAIAPIGLLAACYETVPRLCYIILKSISAGLAGGYGTYHANIYISGLYQRKTLAK